MAWERHGPGMASVNQTRPHCVNQMEKAHSKPLAARHGRGTARAQHAMCESALRVPLFPHGGTRPRDSGSHLYSMALHIIVTQRLSRSLYLASDA